MTLSNIITHASTAVWLFPMFKQYRTRFFIFFLILGLLDPLTWILVIELQIIPQGYIFTIGSLLLFFALDFMKKTESRNLFPKLLMVLIYSVPMFYLTSLHLLVASIHMLILYRIIKFSVIRVYSDSIFNIFYLVLIFYELTLVINLIVLSAETVSGTIIFYATLFFQMLVAVFFTIFREDSPVLSYNIKTAN